MHLNNSGIYTVWFKHYGYYLRSRSKSLITFSQYHSIGLPGFPCLAAFSSLSAPVRSPWSIASSFFSSLPFDAGVFSELIAGLVLVLLLLFAPVLFSRIACCAFAFLISARRVISIKGKAISIAATAALIRKLIVSRGIFMVTEMH